MMVVGGGRDVRGWLRVVLLMLLLLLLVMP
jgi:hypothetical protein